jgi:hypothetical protein
MVFTDSPIVVEYAATKIQCKKAFSTVATMDHIHFASLLDVIELLQNTKRTLAKIKNGNDFTMPDLFAT